jgi:DNA-binding FrmR family transcriptional regulator
MKGNKTSKQQQIISLKKAVSLTGKVLTMTENNKYCIDIIQQINAIKGLLNSVSNSILEQHLNNCFLNGMNSNDANKKEEMIDEIKTVFLKKQI